MKQAERDEALQQMIELEADFWEQIEAAVNQEEVARICETHPYNQLD